MFVRPRELKVKLVCACKARDMRPRPWPSWAVRVRRSALALAFGSVFLAGAAGLTAELLQELLRWQGIDDVLLLEPAAPGHGDAVADEGEVSGVVGVGRDNHLDAALLAHAQIDVFQVEAVG